MAEEGDGVGWRGRGMAGGVGGVWLGASGEGDRHFIVEPGRDPGFDAISMNIDRPINCPFRDTSAVMSNVLRARNESPCCRRGGSDGVFRRKWAFDHDLNGFKTLYESDIRLARST